MDISMAHDPKQDLGHNALYKKLQKNVSTHKIDKIKKVSGDTTANQNPFHLCSLTFSNSFTLIHTSFPTIILLEMHFQCAESLCDTCVRLKARNITTGHNLI